MIANANLRRSPRLQALRDLQARQAQAARPPAPANVVVRPARGQRQRNPPVAGVRNLGAAQGPNIQPDPLLAPVAHISERAIMDEYDFTMSNADYVEKCLVSDRAVLGIWRSRAQMLTRLIFDPNSQPATVELAAASLRNTLGAAKEFGKGFKVFNGDYLKIIADARRALKQLAERHSQTTTYAAQRFLLRARLPTLFWSPLMAKSAVLDVEHRLLYAECLSDVRSAPVDFHMAQLPRRQGRGQPGGQLGQPAVQVNPNPAVFGPQNRPPVNAAGNQLVNVPPVMPNPPVNAAPPPLMPQAIPVPLNVNVGSGVIVAAPPIVPPAVPAPAANAVILRAPQVNAAIPIRPIANVSSGVVVAAQIVQPAVVNTTAPVAAPNSAIVPAQQSRAGPASHAHAAPSASSGPLSSNSVSSRNGASVSASGVHTVVASTSQPAANPRAAVVNQGPVVQLPPAVPGGSRSGDVSVASAPQPVASIAQASAAHVLTTPAAQLLVRAAAQSSAQPQAPRQQSQIRPPRAAGIVPLQQAVRSTVPLLQRPPPVMRNTVPVRRLQGPVNQAQAGSSNSGNGTNDTPATSRSTQQNIRPVPGYLAPTQLSLNRARGGGPVRTHRADVQRVRPPTLTFAPYPAVRRTLRPPSPVPGSSGGAGAPRPTRKRSSSAEAGTKNDGEPAVKRSASRQ